MIDSNNQNITNRIKSLLKNNKSLSQKELATYLQKAPSTISQWFTKNRDIPAECIVPICKYLGCSINWLLTGTEAIDKMHRTLHQEQYAPTQSTDTSSQKLLNTFSMLNEDNKDILIGEAKKLLKEQRLDEKRNILFSKDDAK